MAKGRALVDVMADLPTGLREGEAETLRERLGELKVAAPLDSLAD